MIRELINFTNELVGSSPNILTYNKKPNEGLHIFVELDEFGKWKNNSPVYGQDFDYYDGETEMSHLMQTFMGYEEYGKRVGTTMNKVLETKKKQVFSCSPFIVNFKKQSFSNDKLEGEGCAKIEALLKFYFESARQTCLLEDDEVGRQMSIAFEQNCAHVLKYLGELRVPKMNKDGEIENIAVFEAMKDGFYVSVYLKDIPLEQYKKAHENYLKQKLFNSNAFNSDTETNDGTYGVSDFLNGLNAKKPFLKHKTAPFFKGVSGRITAKDAVVLNTFDTLLSNRVLPNPLPIFVDKGEFLNGEIIRLFNEHPGDRPSYSQVLKKLFDGNRELGKYYLLNMVKREVKDFDFVPLFRYTMKKDGVDCVVQNLFGVRTKGEEDPDETIDSVFGFESNIVRAIFNNALVKVKGEQMTVNYFGEIDPQYVPGGDSIYLLILKYRQAFYDYIYKSQEKVITSLMFDDIMYQSIIGDIRMDEMTDGKYHSKEKDIKRKLNIWFSLYNYFSINHKRKDMATTFINLKERLRAIAKSETEKITTDDEFAYAVGQVVHFLLNKSEASNRTLAIMEPFLQKSDVGQLKLAIGRTLATYVHAIKFYKGKYEFDKIMSEVMEYSPRETNMKNLLPLILAGFFATTLFKKEEIQEE